ncbi:hypothetical protein DKT77_17815 [Meridianimarinicoccus roseus]|uniref:SprT-like domain-containing protein n=1 Tax=Meridianimarinicoccus roseus TaxID=2072018 RepID=A0A2V2LDH4_9RHOB|nr:SprT-like domain-containing protein [Meridianimarinicoccus roseus]PWR01287.1 hypothetical protein DKT77_17815 [Meridianimarinicoccus roseus]
MSIDNQIYRNHPGADNKRLKARTRPRFTFRNFLFVTAMATSWLSTGLGAAFALPEGILPPEVDLAGRIVGGLIFSAVIQAGLGALWGAFGGRLAQRRFSDFVFAVTLLLPALFFSSVSGSLSSGSLVYAINLGILEDRAWEEAAKPAMEAARRMGTASADVRAALSALSAHATTQAEIEEQRGGSCGVQLGHKCGPVCEFRKQQAQSAQELSEKADGLASRAIRIEARAARADRKATADIFAALLDLKHDRSSDELRRWLQTQKDGFQNGFTYNSPKYGMREISCTDPGFERRLEEALGALDVASTVEINPILPTEVTPVSAVQTNLLMMLETLFTLLGDDQEAIRALTSDPQFTDAAPLWCIAALLEAVCALLAAQRGYASVGPNTRPRPLPSGVILHDAAIDPAERRQCAHLLRIVRSYSIRSGKTDYFAAPENGPDADAAINLAARLQLEELPIGLVGQSPEEALVEPSVLRRLSQNGGDSWRLCRDRKGKLRALERALAERVGFATVEEPTPGFANASPTGQAYGELEQAFNLFNRSLFEGRLPPCMITFTRCKGALGYFHGNRWASSSGTVADEIAMNPHHFENRSQKDILSTLVHEMVHLEQHHFGSPSQNGDHNRQWADWMLRVGLVPSHTGKPGGNQTGLSMTHYIVPDGPFDRVASQLLADGFRITYADRIVEADATAPETHPLGTART